jgi:Ca2+-binding EF-hand superfamily protein
VSITDKAVMRRSSAATGDSKIAPTGEAEGDGSSHSRFFKSFHKFTQREKKKSVKPSSSFHKMLTSCQLSDLFRRLDKNGNGELELSEFLLIIQKLKFPVDEEYVNRSLFPPFT